MTRTALGSRAACGTTGQSDVDLAVDPAQRSTEHELRLALPDRFRVHIDPRCDGGRLPVTGAAQHDVVDRDPRAAPVFDPHPEATSPW